MASYEFSEEDAEVLWRFGNQLMILSILVLLTGFLGLLTSLITFTKSSFNLERNWFASISFVLLFPIAYLLFLPSNHFKQIAISEGSDLKELMAGLSLFTKSFLIISAVITVIGVFFFILIF